MWYTISVVHIPYMSCFSHEFSTGPQPPLVCTGHRLWSGGRRPGGIIDPAGPGPGRPRATGGGRCVVLRVEPTSARVSSPAASRGAVAQLGWCGVLPRPPSPRPRAPTLSRLASLYDDSRVSGSRPPTGPEIAWEIAPNPYHPQRCTALYVRLAGSGCLFTIKQ